MFNQWSNLPQGLSSISHIGATAYVLVDPTYAQKIPDGVCISFTEDGTRVANNTPGSYPYMAWASAMQLHNVNFPPYHHQQMALTAARKQTSWLCFRKPTHELANPEHRFDATICQCIGVNRAPILTQEKFLRCRNCYGCCPIL